MLAAARSRMPQSDGVLALALFALTLAAVEEEGVIREEGW